MNKKFGTYESTADGVPYECWYGSYGSVNYTKLNLTGRWKLKSGPTEANALYVEHKSWIGIRFWIHEENIVFRPDTTETIMECA